MKKSISFILVFQLFSLIVSAQVNLVNLLTENSADPVGLDVSQPRFTWQLNSDKRNIAQTAYELKVTLGKTDVWQTGKVNSAQSVHVIYNGPALQSGTKYTWQVRVWDNEGKTSAWSKPATFQMAFLKASDWKAKWIQPGYDRRSGNASKPAHAKRIFGFKKNSLRHGLYYRPWNV